MSDEKTISGQCPRCGKPLPADAPEGLCAACLFETGAATVTQGSFSDHPTISSPHGVPVSKDFDGQRLSPGQAWGPYRIGRMLGKGGMGEVYEAEHRETGRRIALKVLRQRLQNAEDRARFLREGQLAASVSHPHTVYIFGSEEIDGAPAISMELLPGGTLKERVTSQGPLPPAEAASAVLDIIGGLDAAQSAGILHRDIKPSNCFITNEGAVKVGDFGLSISTLARDVHHELDSGGFQGTPQFAAPEQLRGEPLDVRSDIYAVGATLYYLLTGRAPFDARDLHELMVRATTETPVSPRLLRREIPPGLAAIVMQCLDKSPAARPPSYAALAEALRPFASRADAPAHPGLRFVAGVIDNVLLSFPVSVWLMATGRVFTEGDAGATASALWATLLTVAYYVLLEGFGGASLGKRLCGLRVKSVTGSRASLSRVVLRTAVFLVPGFLVGLSGVVAPRETSTHSLVGLVVVAALFVAARRSNGWAGLHDLASGTRVVSASMAPQHRHRAQLAMAAPSMRGGLASEERRFGPFVVSSEGWEIGSGRLLAGFDPVLRRAVWIHPVAPGTPPVSAARHDLGRPGRLFWLTGRRSSNENWDAFEAPDGRPFLMRQSYDGWPALKLWLVDLANELTAAAQDTSTPELALDRLWVRNDGRLVLLDFPAPGIEPIPGTEAAASSRTPVGLLSAVATRALSMATGRAAPLSIPLSARALLQRLRGTTPPGLDEARTTLLAIAAAPDHVQRWRRAIPVGLASTPIIALILFALLILPPLYAFMTQHGEMLSLLEGLRQPRPGSRMSDPQLRDAVERYVSGTYGAVLRDESFWESRIMQGLPLRETAMGILERHPSVSDQELADATALVGPEIQRGSRERNPQDFFSGAAIIVVALAALSLLVVTGAGIVSSAIAPGGLLTRFLGLAVVTRTGEEITRGRSLLRAVIAWLPGIVWLGYLATGPKIQGFVPAPTSPWLGMTVALGLLAAGAIWAVVRPSRGLHDRLVGTWVVPR